MSEMEHISFDKILSYSENQLRNNEKNELECHLATCDRCYRIYMGLKAVENPLSHSFKTEKSTTSCPEDWEIGALIRNEMPAELSGKISAHIKDCDYCMDRSAIYYKALGTEEIAIKTPESWKQKAFQTLTTEKTEAKATSFQRIYNLIRDFTASLSPVPAYATALAAILFLIVWNIIPQKEKIITIASSERIIIRDSEIPSAFGFMGAGESKEVKNMEILYRGKDVVFKWEPIDGVEEYEFSIKDRAEIVYTSRIDKDARASLKKDLVKGDRLYSWLITGRTKDGKYFEYTGDFLLVR